MGIPVGYRVDLDKIGSRALRRRAAGAPGGQYIRDSIAHRVAKPMSQAPIAFNATVLFVMPALDHGGAERITVDLARAVQTAGGRAIVAAAGGRLAPEIEACGAKFVKLPLATKNPLELRRNKDRLMDLIRAWDVELIHAGSRAPAWSALWAARALNIPFLTTYHGFYSSGSRWKRLYNSVMVRGEAVIAHSDFMRRHIEAEHGARSPNIEVIPCGVDLNRFSPDAVTPDRLARIARQWGLATGDRRTRVLLPGRLTSWKGQEIAIEAARQLVETGQEDQFLFILCGDAQGRDGYENQLIRRIRGRHLGEMVNLVGDCADMPAAYLLADVVLSASTRPEAFGRIPVEAQAMGRPVVATNHGGAKETVIPDVTGWLTEPGDAAALAEALRVFVRMTPSGRAGMGREARRRVMETYSETAMSNAVIGLYKKVLDDAYAVSAKRS